MQHSGNNSSLARSGVMQHPAFAGMQVSYSIQEVSDDPDGQVRDVISLMRSYAQQDASDQQARADASRAYVSGDPITDTWNHCRKGGTRGMSFVRDEVTVEPFASYEFSAPGRWQPFVESIARPHLLAQSENPNPHGDCDCFSTYGACHLLIKDTPCSFVTVKADASMPDLYSHVYLVAYPNSGPYAGQRVPLDLSHGAYPGWEVRDVFARKEWPVSGVDLVALAFGLVGASIFAYSAFNRKGLFHPSLWRGI